MNAASRLPSLGPNALKSFSSSKPSLFDTSMKLRRAYPSPSSAYDPVRPEAPIKQGPGSHHEYLDKRTVKGGTERKWKGVSSLAERIIGQAHGAGAGYDKDESDGNIVILGRDTGNTTDTSSTQNTQNTTNVDTNNGNSSTSALADTLQSDSMNADIYPSLAFRGH